MKINRLIVPLAVLAMACSSSKQETRHDAHAGAPHFTYDGEAGPEHWGDLAPEFAACKAGQKQSPVDVKTAGAASLPDLSMHEAPSKLEVLNNGHTIQYNVDGENTLDVDGTTYKLAQWHMHHESEHTLDGRRFPLEFHLVHKSADGKLAVVGVFYQEGAGGTLTPLLNALPKNGEKHPLESMVDPGTLLPSDHSAYRYEGSLTTPPCTEGVTWLVMKTPMNASAAEIASLEAIIAHNARPVQDLHGRGFATENVAAH
jgi:carbonic anhydrase